MLKVLGVSSCVYALMYLCIAGCATKKNIIQDSSYNFKKYKSFDTWIKINVTDKEMPYSEITPILMVNNLYFTKTNLFNTGLGKYNIEISHPSKLTISIKDLVVKKGDSIVINAFLRDDPTPLH